MHKKQQNTKETPSPTSQSTGVNGMDMTDPSKSKKRQRSKMTQPVGQKTPGSQNPMGQDLQIKRPGQLTGGIKPVKDHLEPPAFASDSLAESFGSRQNREMKINMDDVMSERFSFPDSGKGKNGGDHVIEMTQGGLATERAMLEREIGKQSPRRHPSSVSRKKKLLYKIGSGCLCMWMCAVVVLFAIYTLDGIFGVNMMDVFGKPEKQRPIAVKKSNSSNTNGYLLPPAVTISNEKDWQKAQNMEKLDCKVGYFQRGLFCELCAVAEPGCLECTQDTKQCTKCQSGHDLIDGLCLKDCSSDPTREGCNKDSGDESNTNNKKVDGGK